jgi:hypothetical protein
MLSFSKYLKESGCTCWSGYKRKPGTKPCASGSCIKEEANQQQIFNMLEEAAKAIDTGEYDYEGQMARTQLQTILRNSKDLIDMLSDEDNMPEWVQSKITLAQDYITCVRDYLQSKEELDEEHVVHVEVQEATNFNALMAHIKKKQDQAKREKRMEAGKTQGNSAGSWGKLTPKALARIEGSKKLSRNEELSADEQFDLIEQMVMAIAEHNNLDAEMIWEKFETIDDVELLEYAVDAKGHKSSTGGLTQKGRDAYNAKGANLKAPVTTPPSKLKAGSKAANRRKSFCARMGGMEGAMEKPNGEPTRKALALRKWNC